MENCFKNARASHLQIVSVERIQKFQETKFSRNVTHGNCSKISRSKIGNLTHGFFPDMPGNKITKSYPWKKVRKQSFKFCSWKNFKKIRKQNLKILLMKILHFLGDVQPKMCGINFPKNKQSCYQLLSKTSKVVISCYRVNTSKNRVVIKNKQVVISCYQLLSSCYHVWVSTILAKNVHSENSMTEIISCEKMSILRIQWLKIFHMSDEFVFCYKVESVDNSKGKVESNFFWKKQLYFHFFGVARSFQQDHPAGFVQPGFQQRCEGCPVGFFQKGLYIQFRRWVDGWMVRASGLRVWSM